MSPQDDDDDGRDDDGDFDEGDDDFEGDEYSDDGLDDDGHRSAGWTKDEFYSAMFAAMMGERPMPFRGDFFIFVCVYVWV